MVSVSQTNLRQGRDKIGTNLGQKTGLDSPAALFIPGKKHRDALPSEGSLRGIYCYTVAHTEIGGY